MNINYQHNKDFSPILSYTRSLFEIQPDSVTGVKGCNSTKKGETLSLKVK